MKLELKHLAPYLPYGLRITVGNRKLELGTHHSDQAIHIDMVEIYNSSDRSFKRGMKKKYLKMLKRNKKTNTASS